MIKESDKHDTDMHQALNEDIFMAVFRKGAHEYLETSAAPYKDNLEESLSETSEKRIMKMINRQIHKDKANSFIKKFAKIAAIIFIVIAVCAVTIISVDAFRIPVFNFLINTGDEITNIQVDDAEIENQGDTNINTSSFEPAYIPLGFELVSTNETGDLVSQLYMNENEDTLVINQHPIDSNIGIDTESADYKNIQISDKDGFCSVKNRITQLYFSTEQNSYLIISSLDISELIKIASSIK